MADKKKNDTEVQDQDLTLEGRIANDEQAQNNLESEPQAPQVPDYNETDGVNPVGSPHPSVRPVEGDVRNPETIARGEDSDHE